MDYNEREQRLDLLQIKLDKIKEELKSIQKEKQTLLESLNHCNILLEKFTGESND